MEMKLNEFMGKMVGDLGAAMSSALVVLGDRLGLYKAMAALAAGDAGRARRAHRDAERYVARVAQRAGRGRATSPTTRRPAATRCRPSRRSRWPTTTARRSCPALFQVAQAMWSAIDKMEENFRTGDGLEWGQQHPACSRAPSASSAPATSATWSSVVDPGARRA